MKTIVLLFGLLTAVLGYGQSALQQLNAAVKKMEADTQFKHALISLYVVDAQTGKPVFEKNAQTGLAPASCQKVITSVSAFELLGKEYRYKTYIGKDYSSKAGAPADGCLFIIGSGDPTLGSNRWAGTSETAIFNTILGSLKKKGLNQFAEDLVLQDVMYGTNVVPDGWIWQDLGNYYGAGCFGINWKENQYDFVLQPDAKAGYPAKLVTTQPPLYDMVYDNMIRTGAAGSGDNAYLYAAPFSNLIAGRGTVPAQSKPFTISGSMPNPSKVLGAGLLQYLVKNGVSFGGSYYSSLERSLNNTAYHNATHFIDSIVSPSYDSINYWFLKKSVNLFGEAFIKTIAYNKTRNGSTDSGIAVIKYFWKQRGISPAALNIIDGSGLSPANRVTTHALVTVLQYAKKQQWFPSFYYALPEINGIKMKDGYINGVRSYTGFVKSKNGAEYIFSFIVNNFSGSPATVRTKMWQVLDLLK